MRVRRHHRGATRHPSLSRPGNGYGRPGPPRPAPSWNRGALAWRRQAAGWDPGRLLELDLDELADGEFTELPTRDTSVDDGVSEAG